MAAPPTSRSRARLTIVAGVVTALTCAGLVVAVALLPVPVAALPFVAIACVGLPMLAALEVPQAVRALRGERSLASLRRNLERLPETQHPLGL